MGCFDQEEHTMKTKVEKARFFACAAHAGQKYGTAPYALHLAKVYFKLCSSGFRDDEARLTAAWLHDTVEDTDVTIEQIVDEFGGEVATLVDAVSHGNGSNRKVRQKAMYRKLREAPEAVAVKLVDRLSNVLACWAKKDRRLFMYYNEYPEFRRNLYPLDDDPRVRALWKRLDQLLGWRNPPKSRSQREGSASKNPN
jgi:(p)ppGpp synthase/HD superfamily hydrolase